MSNLSIEYILAHKPNHSIMKSKQSILLLFIFCCNSIIMEAQPNRNRLPYEHPDWSLQSNMYEVNLRQFSDQGNFSEFSNSLPRLKEMGIEILCFMPVTPIGMRGRKMSEHEMGNHYAVNNYQETNPEYGSMTDFNKLVEVAHQRGFKVIIDWVANQTAIDHPWVKEHPEYYLKSASGEFVSPPEWTDVYKLDYSHSALWNAMGNSMLFWIDESDVDGFRCHVAEDLHPDFWKEAIGKLKKKKNVFMIAEGNKPWLHEVGFDVTYDWDLMKNMEKLYKGEMNVKLFSTQIQDNLNKFQHDAMRLMFTSNQNENSWNGTEFEKYGEAYPCFAVLTHTMSHSIPMIYNGQESANKKRLKFFVKDPIEWKNYELSDFYGRLLKLRKNNPCLSVNAACDFIQIRKNKNIFAYCRSNGQKKLLVVLNLSKKSQKFKIKSEWIAGQARNVITGKTGLMTSGMSLSIPAWGFEVYEY